MCGNSPTVLIVVQLVGELERLEETVPSDQFRGLPSTLEKRQLEFSEKKAKVDDLAGQCFDHGSSLVGQLETVMRSAREAGYSVSYTNTIRSATVHCTQYRGWC